MGKFLDRGKRFSMRGGAKKSLLNGSGVVNEKQINHLIIIIMASDRPPTRPNITRVVRACLGRPRAAIGTIIFRFGTLTLTHTHTGKLTYTHTHIHRFKITDTQIYSQTNTQHIHIYTQTHKNIDTKLRVIATRARTKMTPRRGILKSRKFHY